MPAQPCFRLPTRRRLLAGLVACAAAVLTAGWPGAAAADEPTAKVTVVIDYADGAQRHYEVAWRKDMTAFDATQAAAGHARGFRLASRGSGETAFITAIDDLENEGRGRNWVYRLNGELAKIGSGAAKLAPNDVVLWRFGPLE